MPTIVDTAAVVVIVLAAAMVVGLIANRLRIPYVVALVVAGMLASIVRPHFLQLEFRPQYLFLVLPALVFEAAWSLDLSALRRTRRVIAFLAVPGVIITLLAIAAIGTVVAKVPWSSALLLGAILSATDPVAVIAVFRRMHIPTTLTTIIEGEAIFNDAVAIVAYELLLPIAVGTATIFNPLIFIARFLYEGIAGIVIGLVTAWLLAIILRRSKDSALQLIGTIVAAYGSYASAEIVHASGIFATATASIALKAFEFFPSHREAADEIEHFWSATAFITNTLLFVLTGLTLRLDRMLNEPVLILLAVLAALLARAFMAYVILPFSVNMRRSPAWRHVVVLAGLRGGVALALALGLPDQTPNRAQIIDTVFGVVFVTLVLQGAPLTPLLARIGMRPVRSHASA